MTNIPKVQRVNLTAYEKGIASPEDQPLFHEAVLAAKAGALRSAYIVTWLSCAESLKRRFREASVQDHAATKIIGRVSTLEKEHKAVDKYLLDQALEYGFISDPGYTTLFHIYEMRFLYGHPYEEVPSKEKLLAAASDVVDLVLSRPVKLRHGFANQLINDLLSSKSYVDDQESAVVKVIESNLPKLDESIHSWMLDKYWKQLEELCDDPSMALFVRRGVWFSQAMLAEVGVSVMDHNQWHTRVKDFPKIMVRVCSSANIFRNIGPLAQDAVVGAALLESETHVSMLSGIEELIEGGALSERQTSRFQQHVLELPWTSIRASGLSIGTCYDRLVKALSSRDFHTQNSAIDMMVANGPEKAFGLTQSQQIELGRTVLRAAEGNAFEAIGFVEDFCDAEPAWPMNVVLGIVLELFTDTDEEIRLQVRHINRVLSALDELDGTDRDCIIQKAVSFIRKGNLYLPVRRRYPEEVVPALESYPWAEALLNILNEKLLSEKNNG